MYFQVLGGRIARAGLDSRTPLSPNSSYVNRNASQISTTTPSSSDDPFRQPGPSFDERMNRKQKSDSVSIDLLMFEYETQNRKPAQFGNQRMTVKLSSVTATRQESFPLHNAFSNSTTAPRNSRKSITKCPRRSCDDNFPFIV